MKMKIKIKNKKMRKKMEMKKLEKKKMRDDVPRFSKCSRNDYTKKIKKK